MSVNILYNTYIKTTEVGTELRVTAGKSYTSVPS